MPVLPLPTDEEHGLCSVWVVPAEQAKLVEPKISPTTGAPVNGTPGRLPATTSGSSASTAPTAYSPGVPGPSYTSSAVKGNQLFG